METATTVGAGAALTSPLWINSLNPYIQLAVGLLGGVWLVVQIYYKIKNKGLPARALPTSRTLRSYGASAV